MNRYIKKYIPELVYVYNGRHALEQPVIASCKENNINFITHEFATNGGYRLCNNTQPQDYSERTKKIKEYLKHDLTDSEYEKGKIYFEKRVGSRQCHITLVRKKNDYKIIENRWNKLDGVKKRQVLPDNWDFKKYNIVIFTSSELEKKVVNQYTHNKIYDNQINAITHIINAARSPHSNIHFYIKLHPSYKFWDNSPQEYKNIVNLELPSNSSFIFPESQIDNYFLINKSNKVVCFRSTAGLESSYFGKPTIFLEDHIIAKLSSVYYPHDQNNAIKLILNENLPPLPNTDSIKYGSYLMSEGILPKYYHRDPNVPYEQNWGLYRGRKVIPSALTLLFINRFIHNQKLLFIIRKIQSLEKNIYNILYKFH